MQLSWIGCYTGVDVGGLISYPPPRKSGGLSRLFLHWFPSSPAWEPVHLLLREVYAVLKLPFYCCARIPRKISQGMFFSLAANSQIQTWAFDFGSSGFLFCEARALPLVIFGVCCVK